MESREENWNKFVVGSVPTLFYIPDFINDTQQQELLRNVIYQAPISKWKALKNRRLQNWGGVVHEKGLLAQDLPPWLRRITNKIFEESCLFPSAINHVLINEYLPNQGIMPHQDGPAYFPVVAIVSLGSPVVMDFTPHSSLQLANTSIKSGDGDDDQWLDGHHPFSVLLMPGSLLVFKDKAYSDYLHGIKDTEWQQYNQAVNVVEDLKHGGSTGTGTKAKQPLEKERSGGAAAGTLQRVEKRVSFTCRVVPKVYKSFFKV
ncbi:uncharacterized protein LOC127806101 isoform X2 [Diospyros lotus]|uniref:uncharacterized protein LOC127806101 isoform X2 n=1 Tax=Diospyros lotus TaxID=55363 RepID=UPI002257367B|nr:uncharacterized protein LOC127806101 isoform X2 [Diospyros lotus]